MVIELEVSRIIFTISDAISIILGINRIDYQ